jgi:hypothetical protein
MRVLNKGLCVVAVLGLATFLANVRIGAVFYRQSFVRFCLFRFEVLSRADRMQHRH